MNTPLVVPCKQIVYLVTAAPPDMELAREERLCRRKNLVLGNGVSVAPM